MCHTRGCPTIGAPLELVEKEVINVLSDWVAGYQLNPSQEVKNNVTEKQALLSAAIANRDALLKQNEKLYDLLEREIYTTDVFLERSSTLHERIEEAELSISALEKDLEYEKQKFENSSRFIPECKELLSGYWDLSVPDRNKALKLLIDRIEYKKTVKNKRGTVDTPTFELTLKPRIPRI